MVDRATAILFLNSCHEFYKTTLLKTCYKCHTSLWE